MQKNRIFQGIAGLVILAGVARYVYALTQVPWTPAFGAAAAAFVLISVAVAWLLLHRHPGRPENPWWLPVGMIAAAGLCGVVPFVNSAYLAAAQERPTLLRTCFPRFRRRLPNYWLRSLSSPLSRRCAGPSRQPWSAWPSARDTPSPRP